MIPEINLLRGPITALAVSVRLRRLDGPLINIGRATLQKKKNESIFSSLRTCRLMVTSWESSCRITPLAAGALQDRAATSPCVRCMPLGGFFLVLCRVFPEKPGPSLFTWTGLSTGAGWTHRGGYNRLIDYTANDSMHQFVHKSINY